jgi:hypothetical protein
MRNDEFDAVEEVVLTPPVFKEESGITLCDVHSDEDDDGWDDDLWDEWDVEAACRCEPWAASPFKLVRPASAVNVVRVSTHKVMSKSLTRIVSSSFPSIVISS